MKNRVRSPKYCKGSIFNLEFFIELSYGSDIRAKESSRLKVYPENMYIFRAVLPNITRYVNQEPSKAELTLMIDNMMVKVNAVVICGS